MSDGASLLGHKVSLLELGFLAVVIQIVLTLPWFTARAKNPPAAQRFLEYSF